MSHWNKSRGGHGSFRSASGSDHDLAASTLMKIVDLGLWSIIFIGPHLFGGRHMLGRFVILTLCIVTALAWFWRQMFITQPRWNRSWSLGIFCAALGTVAFQLAPLPAEWLATLAPRLQQILPLWTTQNSAVPHLGDWRTLSLAPEETRLALATLVAYGLLFVTTTQRIKSVDDIKRLMRWIACSAIFVAGFGIVQYFTSNGKYFWFYEYPYTDTLHEVKAGFTSRNHFAHFLVLGLANLLAWIMLTRWEVNQQRQNLRGTFSGQSRTSSSQASATVLALTLGVTLVIFAILASLSRGGMLAMGSTIAVATAIYARAKILNASHVAAGGLLIVVMMAALSLQGNYEHVAERMGSLTSGSVEKLDDSGGRRRVWSANVAAFRASWLTGAGAGSHRFIYPLYLSESIPKEYTHAENGYLQIATENGLPGILLLAITLGTCCSWCVRALSHAAEDRQLNIIVGGLVAALTASAVHAGVDFVWFIPACMTITVVLAACALRIAQLSAHPAIKVHLQTQLSTTSKFNMALATSLAGVWAVFALFPAAHTSLEWDSYLLADKALQATPERKATASASDLAQLTESVELNSESLLTHLTNVVRDYPASARAQVRLAGALLNRFEALQQQSDNAMAINQIREAAQASNFASPQQLRDWLERAFGENSRLLYQAYYHARRAVELCPLQGEAYLYLAELCFLEGRGPAAFAAYSQQSMAVRPHDPDVLFSIGKSHLIAGNVDEALRIWSVAYQGTGKHQSLIIRILAGRMTATNFLQTFSPDWNSLETLWLNYKQSGTREDLLAILSYAYQSARQQSPALSAYHAGRIWFALSRMQIDMQDAPAALESLQLAYAACPDYFSIRYALGKCLYSCQEFEMAEQHLRWCALQNPDNASLKIELLQATRGKMQRLSRASQTLVHQ